MAILGDDSVARTENGHDAGDSADQPERPEPPDMARKIHRGIRATEFASVGKLHKHLREFASVGLQCFKSESFPNQRTLDTPHPTQTEPAVAVV